MRTKWTEEDVKVLKQCVFQNKTVADGLKSASRKLGRTTDACLWKYYSVIKEDAKPQPQKEQPNAEKLEGFVQKATELKSLIKDINSNIDSILVNINKLINLL